MQNFENKLIQMTKPEVSQLKHQDMLANEITKAKDKSVVSWWWLCIPLYIIATLIMKTIGKMRKNNIDVYLSLSVNS